MNDTLPLPLTLPALEKPSPRTAPMANVLARLAKVLSTLFRAADDPAARRYAASKYGGDLD